MIAIENLGIITNPLAIEAHTHGAAKAIENDMYNIVANYLPKENPVTILLDEERQARKI